MFFNFYTLATELWPTADLITWERLNTDEELSKHKETGQDKITWSESTCARKLSHFWFLIKTKELPDVPEELKCLSLPFYGFDNSDHQLVVLYVFLCVMWSVSCVFNFPNWSDTVNAIQINQSIASVDFRHGHFLFPFSFWATRLTFLARNVNIATLLVLSFWFAPVLIFSGTSHSFMWPFLVTIQWKITGFITHVKISVSKSGAITIFSGSASGSSFSSDGSFLYLLHLLHFTHSSVNLWQISVASATQQDKTGVKLMWSTWKYKNYLTQEEESQLGLPAAGHMKISSKAAPPMGSTISSQGIYLLERPFTANRREALTLVLVYQTYCWKFVTQR